VPARSWLCFWPHEQMLIRLVILICKQQNINVRCLDAYCAGAHSRLKWEHLLVIIDGELPVSFSRVM
jgi:hypothetical protein